MTQKVNHENTEHMYRFGLNFLFDGYLINQIFNQPKLLIINHYLFDCHLIDKRN